MLGRVAITGAVSYSGRYIAKRVLDGGGEVVNLSRRGVPIAMSLTSAEAEKLEASRVRPVWEDVDGLAEAMKGCEVLFCTYWQRFVEKSGDDAHVEAARRCERLFEAAKRASVRKIVFTSHTRASLESPFPYIAGKARAAEALRKCGVDYAIVRPCGVFGDTASESILMNNAAWVLRRAPLFLVAGDGSHPFQPVHVRDLADLALDLGSSHTSGEELDACGPDAPTALELFLRLRDSIAKSRGFPGSIVLAGGPWLSTKVITSLTQPINYLTGDVLLDTDDLDLLCAGLTQADDPKDPRIKERRSLFDWIDRNGADLGKTYVSSIKRYYNNAEK